MDYHYVVIRLFPTVKICLSTIVVVPRVKYSLTKTKGIIGNISPYSKGRIAQIYLPFFGKAFLWIYKSYPRVKIYPAV